MIRSPTSLRTRQSKARNSFRKLAGCDLALRQRREPDLFAADPVKYAPQYGGLCADGVSFGTVTTNIDPKAWRIIEGKLYLAYDPGAADGFGKNATKVANSQKYWPEVNEHLAAEKQAQDWK